MKRNEVTGSLVFITTEISFESVETWVDVINKAVAERERVTLMINSPGGCTAAALGLCNMVRHVWRCAVDTVCLGVAASAAVPIFALGKTRLMMPHSYLLLHGTRSQGDAQVIGAKEMESIARQTQQLDSAYCEMIAACLGKQWTADGVRQIMDKQLVISADSALDGSMATGIYGQPSARRPHKKKTPATR